MTTAPDAPDTALSRAPPPAPPTAPTVRVLAVDDSSANLMVLASFLRHPQVVVQCVDNGTDAVNVYQSFAPDLVFMDLAMPDIDGFAAAAAIRAYEQTTGTTRAAIIALTAFELDAAILQRIAQTMDDHLSKPVRKLDVMRRLQHWTGVQPTGVT